MPRPVRPPVVPDSPHSKNAARSAAGAAAVVAITGLFIVAMEWIPTPLNRNIAQTEAIQRVPGTLVHGVACAAAALVLARGPRWSQRLVPAWFGLVLSSAILNWWVPYFAGGYPGEISPEVFQSEYAANRRLLRAWRGHPVVPDLQHMLIHGLLAASVLLSARVAFGPRREVADQRHHDRQAGAIGAAPHDQPT